MIKFMFSLAVLAACSTSLLAGEKPMPHLTGNSKVDFFSTSSLGMAPSIARNDSTPVFLEESSSMEEEKSPWLAGLLSLAVPGLGEVYTKNYIKAAAFFAADVTFWTLAYSYNKRGDRATDDFQRFANLHWSAVRYANWTLNNIGTLTNGKLSASSYQNVFNSDYDPDAPCGPPFQCVDWAALNTMERDIAADGPEGGNGYTHILPDYNQQQYYELIGKYDEFSRGWDDADQGPLTSLPIVSNSAEFYAYAKMRADANHLYDIAGTYVSVAVVNHILSAADAFWSATRFNKALHAEVHMRLLPTEYGLVPFTEARFSHDF